MASDRQQFHAALEHYRELVFSEKHSAPVNAGIAAILVSEYPLSVVNIDPDEYDSRPDLVMDAEVEDEKEFEVFREEAMALEQKLSGEGKKTEVFLDADDLDLQDVIADAQVSDIHVIGHGTLSYVFMAGAIHDRFDWKNAAKATTHLKTGVFSQRHCGGLWRSLNVPLGLFVVQKPRSVQAAVGEKFSPKGIDCITNRKLRPIFDDDFLLTYDAIKRLLPEEK